MSRNAAGRKGEKCRKGRNEAVTKLATAILLARITDEKLISHH
jgi:hypothetical protein